MLTMSVEDLIAKLSKYDGKLEVRIDIADSDFDVYLGISEVERIDSEFVEQVVLHPDL